MNEFVSSGHFYSVIPKIDGEYVHNFNFIYNGIDYNDEGHLEILKNLKNVLADFDEQFGFPLSAKTRSEDIHNSLCNFYNKQLIENKPGSYYLMNGAFEWMDARMLYYFMKELKPNKIIEVGCGNSTRLMVDINKKFNLKTNLTCVEPYPEQYLNILHDNNDINLIQSPIEKINLNLFTELEKDDILFIDSSHVGKIGSDVLFYLNKVFPILKSGVYIHIHDIFLPFEYPESWIKGGRFWNEQYFLYNFLQYNDKFKVIFGNSYASIKFKDELKIIQQDTYENKYLVERDCKNCDPYGGGSIWLIKNEM